MRRRLRAQGELDGLTHPSCWLEHVFHNFPVEDDIFDDTGADEDGGDAGEVRPQEDEGGVPQEALEQEGDGGPIDPRARGEAEPGEEARDVPLPRRRLGGGPRPLTNKDRELVKRVHVNSGYPPVERLARVLKAAGARAEVLKYVLEEFSCDVCSKHRGPEPRRRVALPRTFAFNHIIGTDTFFIA